MLVGILSEMANADARHLDSIPRELWITLCRWFFVYPDNNLYHGLFYKLLHRALRANHVSVLETVFSHGRLMDQLLEAYMRGRKVRAGEMFISRPTSRHGCWITGDDFGGGNRLSGMDACVWP